jgi:Tfp pilus assembly protein PilN
MKNFEIHIFKPKQPQYRSEINLYERIYASRVSKSTALGYLPAAIITFLAILAIVLSVVFSSTLLNGEQKKKTQLKAQIGALSGQVKKADDLEAKINILQSQLDAIEVLLPNKMEALDFLEELEKAAVSGIEITSLSVSNGALTLSGSGSDLTNIADYLTSLNRCGLFSAVSISSIGAENEEGRRAYAISAIIAPYSNS